MLYLVVDLIIRSRRVLKQLYLSNTIGLFIFKITLTHVFTLVKQFKVCRCRFLLTQTPIRLALAYSTGTRSSYGFLFVIYHLHKVLNISYSFRERIFQAASFSTTFQVITFNYKVSFKLLSFKCFPILLRLLNFICSWNKFRFKVGPVAIENKEEQ